MGRSVLTRGASLTLTLGRRLIPSAWRREEPPKIFPNAKPANANADLSPLRHLPPSSNSFEVNAPSGTAGFHSAAV